MDGVDAQLSEVLDGPRFGERQELAGMAGVRTGDGEVAVVHLVDDEVGRRFHHRSHVAGPSFRIGFGRVDDGSPLAVDPHGLGKHAGCLATPDVEGIEPAHQIALDGSRPTVWLAGPLHLDRFNGLSSKSFLIDTHFDCLCRRGGKE